MAQCSEKINSVRSAEVEVEPVAPEGLIRGSYRGGLWHGSRAEKTTNHESRISKFHFPESRKSARKTLLSCECLKIQQNREKKKKDCK